MNIDAILLLKNFVNHNIRDETIIIYEYILYCSKSINQEYDLFENYKPIREIFLNDKKKFLNFIDEIIGHAPFHCIPFTSQCEYIEKKLIDLVKKNNHIIPKKEKILNNNPLDMMSITTSAPSTFSNFLNNENNSINIDEEVNLHPFDKINRHLDFENNNDNIIKKRNMNFDTPYVIDNKTYNRSSINSFYDFDKYNINDNTKNINSIYSEDLYGDNIENYDDETFIDYILTPNF